MNNNRWLGMSFTIAKMWKLFIHFFFCRGKFRSCHSEVGLLTYQSFTVLPYLRHYSRTIVDSSSFLGVLEIPYSYLRPGTNTQCNKVLYKERALCGEQLSTLEYLYMCPPELPHSVLLGWVSCTNCFCVRHRSLLNVLPAWVNPVSKGPHNNMDLMVLWLAPTCEDGSADNTALLTPADSFETDLIFCGRKQTGQGVVCNIAVNHHAVYSTCRGHEREASTWTPELSHWSPSSRTGYAA